MSVIKEIKKHLNPKLGMDPIDCQFKIVKTCTGKDSLERSAM